MRILVVSDLPPFVTGGAEMQAARLIEAWLESGHEVICIGRRMGRGPVRVGRHNLEVHRIRTTSLLGRWGRAFSYALSLSWLLLEHRRWADIIYARFLGEAATTAALLKRVGLLKTALVATPASAGIGGDIAFLATLPRGQWIVRLLDGQCDAINLIADAMTDRLRKAGFSGRNITRIPNGIPVRGRAQRLSGPFRCILVGRLSREKGYDIFLEALSRVRDHIRLPQCVIIGDGPEREHLRDLAATLQLSEHIVWRGELTPDSIFLELERAHLYVLPSLYEGMSNAGLEAMERSLPVILTKCGGLDRHVDPDMGWVVDPSNAQQLAQAMVAALGCPLEILTAMGERCREKIEREFDMNTVATRYIQLFKQLHTVIAAGQRLT